MWFQVDLGKEIAIPRLVLNAAASGNDFPRGYKVYLSADGKAWGDPAAEGKGSANVTSIDLAAKKARFVKIEQTGAVEGGYWSIHELEIQTPSDVEKFAHATQIAERIAEK